MKQHITLVGREPLPIYYAIREYGPDNVFFICSDDTKSVAKKIIKTLPSSIKSHIYIVNPFMPQETENCCKEVHLNYEGEFTYNLTGGTKPMAFAAFNVAKANQSHTIYTTQENQILSLEDYHTEPMTTTLNNHEILSLSGNVVLKYQKLYSEDSEIYQASKLIYHFMNNHRRLYDKLRKAIYYKDHGSIAFIPKKIEIEPGCNFKKEEHGFSIYKDESSLLSLPFRGAYELVFAGRWWENVVASEVARWNEHANKEIWQNVVFKVRSSLDQSKVKNEVDILINNDTKLIFVECKSGKVGQDDIYKIDAVRDTYGGDKSQTILATLYPVPDDIREKCKESQIHIFQMKKHPKETGDIGKLSAFLNELKDDLLI